MDLRERTIKEGEKQVQVTKIMTGHVTQMPWHMPHQHTHVMPCQQERKKRFF
jgi:hypothetical protein